MAQRKLKGTYVRNTWDFYETGDAVANGFESFPAGQVYVAFINSTQLQGNMDLYRADLFSDSPQKWIWYVARPAPLTTIIGLPFQAVLPLQADLGMPDGIIVQLSGVGIASWFQLGQRLEGVTMDTLQLNNGGPFLSLPPQWGLVIGSNLGVGGANIGLRVWYQIITDQVRPAE